VFGDILSRYTGVVLLNEPRQLWIPLLPEVDVWSTAAPRRNGRLTIASDDARRGVLPEAEGAVEGCTDVSSNGGPDLAEVIGDAYHDVAQLVLGSEESFDDCRRPEEPSADEVRNGPRSDALSGDEARSSQLGARPCFAQRIVLEKFPEHAFRLPFLATICERGLGPGTCSFVHLIRDGVDVARSIAGFGSSAAWYGVKGDWKWQQLVAILGDRGLGLGEEYTRFLKSRDLKTQGFARGLVEWALTVEAAREGAKALASSASFLEVRYEDLVANPEGTLDALEAFLGLERSLEVRRCATATLKARWDRSFSTNEAAVLRALQGSRVEALLHEFGRVLPS